MKIKTLVESLEEGHKEVFKKLDVGTNSLGTVFIKNVTDSFYPAHSKNNRVHPGYISRTIIYEEKERWKATLDTGIREVLIHEPRLSDENVRFLKGIYGECVYLKEECGRRDIWVETLKDLIEIGGPHLKYTNYQIGWQGPFLIDKERRKLNNLFKEYGIQTIRS